jgi:hypothetical protein
MNRFCWKCEHKIIPKFLKQKFNEFANKIFIDECPLDDKNVKGCTTKMFYSVDWPSFCMFLLQNNLVTEEERKNIAGFLNTSSGDSTSLPIIS